MISGKTFHKQTPMS